MAELEPYPTPSGVEAATKDAAKRAASTDPSLTISERIRLAYFDRFLSRVFWHPGEHAGAALQHPFRDGALGPSWRDRVA